MMLPDDPQGGAVFFFAVVRHTAGEATAGSTGECCGKPCDHRWPVGRRGQGQDRRHAQPQGRLGAALPGRRQRRPHHPHRRPEARAAPGPGRDPARRCEVLPGRGHGHRSMEPAGRDPGAGAARHEGARAVACFGYGASGAAFPQAPGRTARDASEAQEHRDDRSRDRPGLPGQGTADRDAHGRPAAAAREPRAQGHREGALGQRDPEPVLRGRPTAGEGDCRGTGGPVAVSGPDDRQSL